LLVNIVLYFLHRTAVEVENIVRTHGVVPATIAVLNGRIHIGNTRLCLACNTFAAIAL